MVKIALSDAEVVYNKALSLIGEYVITEGDTTSTQAVLCIRFYTDARDEVLESHPWNFAKAIVIISEESDRPIFGYDRKYAEPSDCLRVLTCDNSLGSDVSRKQAGVPAWESKSGYIHADAGATPSSWVTDTKYYDGQFFAVTPDTWATGTAYIDDQYVKVGTTIYEVLADHTSDTIVNDLASADIVSRGTGTIVTYEVLVSHTSDTVVADITSANIEAKGVDKRIVYVEYIWQEDDIDNWSRKAVYALSVNLASKIITGVTNDTKGKIDLINEFNSLVMPQARSIDGAEGKPRPIFTSEWLRARQGGSGGVYVV